jgi:hypothetical protein
MLPSTGRPKTSNEATLPVVKQHDNKNLQDIKLILISLQFRSPDNSAPRHESTTVERKFSF